MGLALVIAIVGSILRRIKIKKFETKKKSEYDRKVTVNKDEIRRKAKAMQEDEIKETNSAISKLETELEELEKNHKAEVLCERKKGASGKQIEKKFKSYAQARGKMQEKLTTLKEYKTTLATAEHLMALEKKLEINEEKKLKELKNVSKKEIEEAKKQNKVKSNDNK